MKAQRHLRPDQQHMLREVVARQRPEHLSLLDDLYLRPLRLEERRSLARAITCEIHQRGYQTDEILDLWHLRVCFGLRCMLTDDQQNLLHKVFVRYNPAMLDLIDERDYSSWDEGQRKTAIQIIGRAYTAKSNQGIKERKELNDTGHLLIELLSHVQADTSLHPDDLALFHEVIAKWNPRKRLLLENLGERPLQQKERSSLYNVITAEIQESGAKIGAYTSRLEGLIDYVGSLPSVPTIIEADDVIEIVNCVDEAGISVWLDGGWGVDALIGEETRPHDDLDIVMAMEQVDAACDALHALGFIMAVDELPTRCVLRDTGDRRIDVHPVDFDSEGGGLQQQPDGPPFRYSPDGLAGVGTIAGVPVHCLSPELQLRCHLAYEPDDDDRHDMRLLCARFGLPLPDVFKHH